MEMFKVRNYTQEIEKIEVLRTTDQSFWVLDNRGKERRELIITNYYRHFKSFEEAKNHIIERERMNLEYAKDSVTRAEQEYKKAKLISKWIIN